MKTSSETRSAYAKWCEHYGYNPGELKSRQDYAEYCKQNDLLTRIVDQDKRKPGRKPKLKSGAMTAAERKAAERHRRAARGEVQMWLTPEEVAAVERMRS
jgi:hypothetical protein